MRKYFIGLILLLWATGCSKDGALETTELQEQENIQEPPSPNEGNGGENGGSETAKAGETTIFIENLVDLSPLLVNDAVNNRVYLMDKDSKILHEWELKTGLGNDCVLLENGKLLALLEANSPTITFGGFAGNLQLVNPDNSIEWEYKISNDNMISHHDVEMLPNGNVIILVWMKKTGEEAIQEGFKFNYDVYPESVFELDPSKMEIVWEWHSWDHLIQEYDESKSNFGVVSENPGKININYNPNQSGDIMHANGITYDSKNDLIYLSINFFSEIWVIDHSTSMEEAKTGAGGNYNKGGDLVYRFGNPLAYNNTAAERRFYNQHYPNLQINEDRNTMLLFMNGNTLGQSTVYEFNLPDQLLLEPNKNNEPEILWSFTHPDLYSQKVSGAEELPNGNILITEGDYGAWEITRNGEIVWKFKGDGFFWRMYPYHSDSDALSHFNLDL